MNETFIAIRKKLTKDIINSELQVDSKMELLDCSCLQEIDSFLIQEDATLWLQPNKYKSLKAELLNQFT